MVVAIPMAVSAVLFDLDETLLDRTTSLRAFLSDQHRRFSDRLGTVEVDAWISRFLALDDRGRVHKSIVYPALLDVFGGDNSAADGLLADYLERCSSYARALPGMADTLEALRARGISLGIVTNGEMVFQARHIDVLGLRELVDVVLISQAESLRKPEAALFQRAAERLGVPPGRCLFVGDNPEADILGAHAAGMQTAWLRRGANWPEALPPPPGATIDALSEVLTLLH